MFSISLYQFQVQAITSSLKNACQLTSQSINGEQSRCSGIYLNDTTFLTAAHCIDVIDAAAAKPEYYKDIQINCLNEQGIKEKALEVERIFIHPNFFASSFVTAFSQYEALSPNQITGMLNGEVNPAYGYVGRNTYNDLAILITESSGKNLTQEVLGLTTLDEISQGKCSLLGYTSKPSDIKATCNKDVKGLCLRQDLSASSPRPIGETAMVNSCDVLSGTGCFLNSLIVDQPTVTSPLMVAVKHAGSAHRLSSPGDSGAPLICENKNGDNVLVGIWASHVDPQVISLLGRDRFLSQYLNSTKEQNLKKPSTFKLNQGWKQAELLKREINTLVSRGTFSTYERPPIISSAALADQISVLTHLKTWIEKDPKAAANYLRKNRVSRIRITSNFKSEFESLWKAGKRSVIQVSKDLERVHPRRPAEKKENELVLDTTATNFKDVYLTSINSPMLGITF